MSGTYLVTAGNIGNSVIEGLIARGKKIRAAVLKKKPNAIWDVAGIEQVEFDYARPETLKRAFDGVEAYFCLSPLIQNLAETGIQAVEVAKQAGVRRIVRSSALGAAGDAVTFARWHRAVEKAVEASGISYTILQPIAFMQNYLLFAETIKREGRFYAPVGYAKACYVDTRDIADVAVLALAETGHTGKKYRITGGEAISNFDVAELLSRAAGITVQYVPVSDEAARQAMEAMGVPGWMVDGFSELNHILAKGWMAGVETDFESVTGRKPRTFGQFARDFRSAFVNESAAKRSA